ncbi:toxin-antitoxin system YwqK family antitoxin [Fusobacterium sp.]|uniref:toxin-antitoxin system YwqK family antitoxin n=1 Tax=Fusobacterium sp. TaxID=68766 RepID=UPI002900B74E|nr:toxin-antitoxin system YwqK family antitoxin [Fusobacterium sp.]MDU1912342.1 toxin-antitoxin system YwqK family antitoxin [Fusobacterium sp.]
MKKVILILVILLFTSCYKRRIEDISKQEIKNGIIYKINEVKPYSGTFIEKYEEDKFHIIQDKNGENKSYYKGGKIRKEVVYKNGVKEGTEKTYYPNGQLKIEIIYKKGTKEGKMKRYYPNGQLQYEVFYKHGEKEGIEKTYYKNGNLRLEIPYKNSKIVGVEKRYYESGELFGEITYSNEDVKEVYYEKNGEIKE